MKKLVFLLAVMLSVATMGNAQSMGRTYTTALGVKVWDGAGITLKHFTQTNRALEFIGYFHRRGMRITGLYEIHGDINGAPGLKWYIGPGAHVGFYDDKYYDDRYGNGVYAGIDGVLGLDYKINKAPINISLDWQPSFEFGRGRGFYGNLGGLGIRYTF